MKNLTCLFIIMCITIFNVHAQDDIRFRSDCEPGQSQAELNINNVRARLSHSGAMFNDHGAGSYEIPKSELGEESGASAIYAAGVWVGGLQNSNFKVAAVKTGLSQGDTDWYPGPLDEQGEITSEQCSNWDKHFEVLGEDISNFIDLFEAQGGMVDVADVPESILGWPSKDNPHFMDIYGFILPSGEEFASFYDRNSDHIYNPLDGDYPVIGQEGCVNSYADQMVFWIYNDNGQFHTESGGEAMRIEVHQLSYAFISDNDINDMTFHKFTLINRSPSDIDSIYFGLWMDPDLGCSEDDYVGCSIGHNLAYVYNSDAIDGISGCTCTGIGSQTTYCDEVPILGVDILNDDMASFNLDSRQPLDDTELGDSNYYNQLSGTNRDGTPILDPISGAVIKHVLYDPPNLTEGWSMSSIGFPNSDPRWIQSVGYFKLEPGQRRDIFMGIYFAPDIPDYPRPSIDPLLELDNLAKEFYDNCFDLSSLVANQDINALPLKLYPNPTSGVVYIDTDNIRNTDFQVNIIDIQGRVVLSQVYKEMVRQEININQLSTGTYIIHVISNEGAWLDKLIIN